jgi:hypothetical protein
MLILPELRGAKNVSDLMATEEGRDFGFNRV